ncbi:hypothetical protein Dsin_025172 [Dipteronia sinensis]|uniref:Glutathione peroxidase n=1 Tax=Dipteronia sinensis TaxID=43782 RepID=A0AAE0DWP9_9ROSI|nr:hypothetical protein Dsin_025172 [Dipteronia sinensis]
MDDVDGKGHIGSSSIQTIETVVQVENAEHFSPDNDRGQASFRSDQGSLDQMLPLKDEGNTENLRLSNFKAENVDKRIDTLDHTELSLDPVSGADRSARISPCDRVDTLQYSAVGTGCENTELLKSQIDYNYQTNSTCEAAEEVKHKEGQKGESSASISDDRLGDKDASGVQLSSSPVDGVDSPARGSPANTSLCHISTSESANIIQNNGYCSPSVHLQHKKTLAAPVADEESKTDAPVTQRPKSAGKWSNNSEAHAALSSFEAVLGSLTRTKESIGRATRIAIDCAKFGVSNKVMEILARSLESESNLHKRVDLFFLVDSITQCSRGLKGDVGCIYPPAIQAMLPRLLSAAAPPGSIAQENRRQCLKVLRLWLERRILPETVVRHHMRELDSLSCSSSVVTHSRRSSRTERALDDPIRDMEGMHVDEYGSNSSFQLPGFCMPRMLKEEDEGSDSDGGSFEAVTPEHNSETPEEREATPAIEKHRHILEDVDGELEMEDVAPSCDIDKSSTNCDAGVNISQTAHDQFLPFAPPLPQDLPPSSPPLPSSPPPPPPPPPPPLPHPCAMSEPYSNAGGMHNMQNDVRQSVAQQSVAPRINSTMPSDTVNYNASECRDLQRPMQMSDSNSSFSSYRACSSNNIQQTDGPRFHHKPYPPRPPHVPPSNQFSYVQASQNVKSRREAPPPSHSHRFHPLPNFDGGNYYNNHDRMQPPPYEHRDNNHDRMQPPPYEHRDNNHDRMQPPLYEHRESWRFPAPSFSGSRYPDKVKDSYASGSYVGPPCEPSRLPNQGWAHPPRSMNHRNSLPVRPPSGGAVPVGARESVPEKSIHEFTVKDSRGKDVELSTYKGKVLLVVNVASKCGFTDTNYTQLTELYEKYKDKGFEVLAFPCNQFLKQEPGSSKDAEEFACTRYKAEYPIFHKVRVNGPTAAPVYKFLKASKPCGLFGSRIKWNFAKFLVDKDGVVINRYGTTTAPMTIEPEIKKALGVE